MRTLLEQMLELAKGDHQESQAQYEDVDLGELVDQETMSYFEKASKMELGELHFAHHIFRYSPNYDQNPCFRSMKTGVLRQSEQHSIP